MAMLSSYTLLSWAAPPAPGLKFSPVAVAALQLRKQPAAVASVVALRWASCKEPRRLPLFVCHAQKYKYDIQPGALQTPNLEGGGKDKDWNMIGDKDLIILKFRVGASMTKDKVKVETTPDQTHLVIRYTGDTKDDTVPASDLNVQLAMPPGYDGSKVTAKLSDEWLVITIVKPKHDPSNIAVE